MPEPPSRPSRDLLGPAVLVAIVLALLAGWWLFPRLYAAVSRQDCIAVGRTDCGQ